MQVMATDKMNADKLNSEIMSMAQNTAIHQRPEKLTKIIIDANLNTPTLALATASLQHNSQVIYDQTEHLRSLMKVMLDSQMLNDQLDMAMKVARASDDQATASRKLARVTVWLTASATFFAAVQIAIALVHHSH